MERNARIRAGLSDVPEGGLDMSYKAIDFKNAIYEAGDPKIHNSASGSATYAPTEAELETMRLAEEQAKNEGRAPPRHKEEDQTWIRPINDILGEENEDSGFIDKILDGERNLQKLSTQMNEIGSSHQTQQEQYVSSRPKYDPIVEEEDNTPKAYNGGYTAPPTPEENVPVRGPDRGDGLKPSSAGNYFSCLQIPFQVN